VRTFATRDDLFWAFSRIGGTGGYYTQDWAWRLRGLIDVRVGGVGLRRGRRHPGSPPVMSEHFSCDKHELPVATVPTLVGTRSNMALKTDAVGVDQAASVRAESGQGVNNSVGMH
jgi:hypothetical protein